jgi:hypothetical protein
MASLAGAVAPLVPLDYNTAHPEGVEDIDVYEPQATPDAAARWCEDTLGIPEVKFKGLTPETANAIARGLFDDVKACGKLKLSAVQSKPKNDMSGFNYQALMATVVSRDPIEARSGSWVEMNVDELADYIPRPRKLQEEMNKLAARIEKPVLSDSVKAIIDQIPADAQLGFTVADMSPTVDGSLEALITHELGHARMNTAPMACKKAAREIYYKVTGHDTYNEDKDGGPVSLSIIARHLNEFPSEYALSSYKEFFAECYSAYRTGIARERVPQEMIELIEQYFHADKKEKQ